MEQQIEKLIENIVEDYKLFDSTNSRVEEFKSKLFTKVGNKYTKIISNGSVWGFIVNEDDGKFKRGDILKAANFNTPTKNKARGNIFGEYSVNWTGPKYLRGGY